MTNIYDAKIEIQCDVYEAKAHFEQCVRVVCSMFNVH